MPVEPGWLDPREDRAWRSFVHARHRLFLRLNRHLLQDSGLTGADYEVLAVLSEHPAGRMSAQELGVLLQDLRERAALRLFTSCGRRTRPLAA